MVKRFVCTVQGIACLVHAAGCVPLDEMENESPNKELKHLWNPKAQHMENKTQLTLHRASNTTVQ